MKDKVNADVINHLRETKNLHGSVYTDMANIEYVANDLGISKNEVLSSISNFIDDKLE